MSVYYLQPDWTPVRPNLDTFDDIPVPVRIPDKNFTGITTRNLILDICAAKALDKPADLICDMVHELNVRVHEGLAKFFPNPAAFISILGLTNAVVSGSWLLAFLLSPETWTAKDLDVFVPRGPPGQIIEEFLQLAGYTRIRSFSGAAAGYMADTNALRYVSHVVTWSNDDLGTSVDIVHGLTDFAVDVIRGFHSTVVMNMLSASHIVVMFPESTFCREGFAVDTITTSVKNKYLGRGFKLVSSNADFARACGTTCPSLVRSLFHSKTSLAVPIDTRFTAIPPAVAPVAKYWTAPVACENLNCINNIFVKMGGVE